MIKQTSKRGKAWAKHTPSRKELGYIHLKNRVNPVVTDLFLGVRSAPLKRKYLVNRAYMQAPVGSPAQPKRTNTRAGFPMSRNRAIPSSLVDLERR